MPREHARNCWLLECCDAQGLRFVKAGANRAPRPDGGIVA